MATPYLANVRLHPKRRQEAIDVGLGRELHDLGGVREQKALEAHEHGQQHALGEPVGEQNAVEHLLRGRAVELDPARVALAHPEVPVIIPHFGAGFFREALMAADMSRNILLDTSSSNDWISGLLL